MRKERTCKSGTDDKGNKKRIKGNQYDEARRKEGTYGEEMEDIRIGMHGELRGKIDA